MRILLFFIFITPSILLAQDSIYRKDQSLGSKFLLRKTVLKREFIEIGSVKNMSFTVVHIKDEIKGDSISCLYLNKPDPGSWGKGSIIAALDADEVPVFLDFLNELYFKTIKTTPFVYTEYRYYSKSGFKFHCYFKNASKWKLFMRSEDFDSTYFSFSVLDLPQLIVMLKASQKAL